MTTLFKNLTIQDIVLILQIILIDKCDFDWHLTLMKLLYFKFVDGHFKSAIKIYATGYVEIIIQTLNH